MILSGQHDFCCSLDQTSRRWFNFPILIGQGKSMSERIVLLRELAVKQMETLSTVSIDGIKQLSCGDAEKK